MYLAASPSEVPQYREDEHQTARRRDERLKYRIRMLKLVSRLFATVISLAVFVPIAMTFNLFLQTRDTFRIVDTPTGADYRTAWAKQTNPWPTYMYFAVALASLFLNASILVAYSRSIKLANIAATTSTVFEWLVILSNLIVWSVAVTLYRTEKDKGGKPNDLWGWTCSDAARLIQHAFEEVDFNRYCGIQSASWHAGILQGATTLLSGVIYYLAVLRRKAKSHVRRSLTERLYHQG